jgi:hypothetical protein
VLEFFHSSAPAASSAVPGTPEAPADAPEAWISHVDGRLYFKAKGMVRRRD